MKEILDSKIIGYSLGLTSILAGACLGYCNTKGIPLNNKSLELGLAYWPIIVSATRGAIGGFNIGVKEGPRITQGRNVPKLIAPVIYGTVGAAGTLAGYGLGSLAGYLNK